METPECPIKSLSLDEAIAHADEVAADCGTACKREHKQLADWLRELKARRSSERGDCARLREALEKCANWGEQIDCQLGSSDETVYAFRYERCLAHNISECAHAALSAPPRNCDLPKVVEDPWRAWLDDESNWEDGNPKLEIHDWLLATTTKKEGGVK